MARKTNNRVGRPPGRTHVEVFAVKLLKGTLAAWRKAAKREGLTVAEMVRSAMAERIAGPDYRRKSKLGQARRA